MKFITICGIAVLSYSYCPAQNVKNNVFVDPRDDREYKTVKIGTQVWFAENFAYLPQVDTVNVSVYGYKGNSIAAAKKLASYWKYGALYSWEMAKKLAPKGWRLPTDADWQQLEKQLGVSQVTVNTIGWRGDHKEANGLKADSAWGFNIVFGGWRTDHGVFNFQEQHANFWCADSHDGPRAIERLIGVKNPKIGRDYGNKGCGFSVRYIKDTPDEATIYYPGPTWERLTNAKDYGWNAGKLAKLHDFVRDSTHATGLVIVQSGKVLLDYGDTKELSYIASCRKSLLSMLYGNYVQNGTIKLNKTLAELNMDDIGGLSPGEKTATVLDLLKSKSGVFHPASNEGGNENLFPKRGSRPPGTFFVYNNWDFNAAGFVFEKETGLNIYDAFEKDIARKVGFEDWDRSKQYKGGDTTKSRFKAYHFVLSTRDMARIGYLMLRNGRWQNVQVIPQDWVSRITTVTTSLEEMKTVDPTIKYKPWWRFGYGLLWRLWDSPEQQPELNKAYTATGNLGQYITIIPGLDVVIALKTKDVYARGTDYDVYMKLIDKLIEAKK